MTDRRLTPAVLLVALCVSACSTTAVESTPPAQAKAPTIVALFSPTSVTGESIRDETIRRIDQTTHTLDVAMYGFNEPTLSEALIRAKARGVTLRIIMDATQAGSSTSQSNALKAAGISIKLMHGIKGNGIMHHKVAIYDEVVVQTGSFNWTDNASCCSWENAVFLADPSVVRRYQVEFDRMWNRE